MDPFVDSLLTLFYDSVGLQMFFDTGKGMESIYKWVSRQNSSLQYHNNVEYHEFVMKIKGEMHLDSTLVSSLISFLISEWLCLFSQESLNEQYDVLDLASNS